MIEVPITVVVLAAGMGTRLGNLRLAHSKAMTPILGVPLIERVVEGFARNCCREFVVVAAPDDEPMISWAEKLRTDGLEVRLAFQEERKGTAHALLQARPLIHQDFAVTSCDNLYHQSHIANLISSHLTHRPPAVITIADYEQKDLDRAAGVKLSGSMVMEIREKPGSKEKGWDAISKFLFIFNKGMLECLDAVEPSARGEMELQDAISMFMDMSDEFSRAVKTDTFLHLTSAEDLITIHRHYLDHHRTCIIHHEAKVEPGVLMRHPVMVDKGALVKTGCSLGPYVYVGKGAALGRGVVVENTVIYPGVSVEPGRTIRGEIVAK